MKKQFYSTLFFAILLIFSTTNLYAQGTSCATATPFCTSVPIAYPAGSGGGIVAPAGPNYGCISSGRNNPAWFYLQIDNPGVIEMALNMSNPLDLDFAVWGPFAPSSNLTAICNQISSGTVAPSDCSFAGGTAAETPQVTGTTGQIFVLIITNFSNRPTDVTISQISGAGTTSCNIVCNVDAGNYRTACATDTLIADVGGDATDWNFQWFENGSAVAGATQQEFITDFGYPTAPNRSAEVLYRVVATNPNFGCTVEDTVSISYQNKRACGILPEYQPVLSGTASYSKVDLQWNAPQGQAAEEISEFEVYMTDDGGETYTLLTITDRTTLQVDLINGRNYGFRVRGIYVIQSGNNYETSPYSNVVYLKPSIVLGENDKSNSALKLFPNPSNGNFTIQFNDFDAEEGTLNIVDLTGKVIFTKELKNINNKSEEQLELPNVDNGIYIIQVQTQKGVYQQKVMVVK
ncbi:T9SS type A sorting domain-containing protein [Bernardetia sp. OM2101]|uniref:T9SS type A sorting domain-containing protein n=1 Tax=Bernardetia sp. OM2101 TaxID=3344876 RepID=UPI0035CEF41D